MRVPIILAVASSAALLAGCGDHLDQNPAQILLFTGTGTSPGDVSAFQTILDAEHVTYSEADSERLNRMSEPRLRAYRLLIVPGGDFIRIGENLSPGTSVRVRDAVGNGLNYLGICAGAFFAGNSPSNGLNLTGGIRFGFYSAESHSIRKAAIPITRPNARTLDQYWEDGPDLSGWGTVAAKYPDGTPAIVQGIYGKGAVILAGVHAEAPAKWRYGMIFRTSVKDDNAYAVELIRAALARTVLPHY